MKYIAKFVKPKVVHYVLGYGLAWFIIWLVFCVIKDNI